MGWYTDPIGGQEVTSQTSVTGEVTYYAHWERIIYFTEKGNI